MNNLPGDINTDYRHIAKPWPLAVIVQLNHQTLTNNAMRRLIQIMHISLDGFVAGTKGELDWFENANEHLSFVNELLQTSDSIMLGRVTYDMFNSYWPAIETSETSSIEEKNYSRWYNNVTKIVLSRTLQVLKEKNSIVVNKDVVATVEQLKNLSGRDILLFGSPTVGQLLAEKNLIDEYWIFVNPVVFGAGIPMFNEKAHLTRLKLLKTNIISNDEIALHYSVESKNNDR